MAGMLGDEHQSTLASPDRRVRWWPQSRSNPHQTCAAMSEHTTDTWIISQLVHVVRVSGWASKPLLLRLVLARQFGVPSIIAAEALLLGCDLGLETGTDGRSIGLEGGGATGSKEGSRSDMDGKCGRGRVRVT